MNLNQNEAMRMEKHKSTNELVHELQKTPKISNFLIENKAELSLPKLTEHLQHLLAEKHLTKADLVKESGLYRTYVYQILSGEKAPSRIKLLAFALTLKLNFTETQYLLKYGNATELYIRDHWDSIIIYALENHYSVEKTNRLLYDLGFTETIIR